MTPSAGARAPKWVRVRLCFTAVVMVGLFGAIGYKAWTVQIRDGARMRALGERQYLHELELPAPRGAIRDANGAELAVSVGVPSVFANPRAIADPRRAARALAKALDVDPEVIEARLRSRKYFVWIKRRVDPDEARRVRELAIPGVDLTEETRRFYPGRDLAGPVIGFAGADGKGLEGVELAMDQALRGAARALPVLRDGRGAVLVSAGWGEGQPEPTTEGASVTLTIDRFIQFAAERALADAVREHKARSGVVVVLDPRSGDVLAMASLPTYDPNDPRDRDEARNRPVTDAFEPGSSMKVFTVAAALEAGAIEAGDWVDVEGGRLQIGKKTIRDTHFERSMLSVGEVVKFSSNVGAAKIARKLGKERFAEALRRFGFGAPTGIDLPGERSGLVRDTKRWGEIGLATASFGYGMTATPLQLAAALGAVANGGTWYKPRLVKRVAAPNGRVLAEPAPDGRRVLRPETAAALTAMMITVMEEGGTGEKIKVPGFLVAGKTGTAHKVDPRTRRYSADRYLASFVGFAPAHDPRLVIVVMIDEPRGKKYFGGVVAGPVFARIASECLKYLGVAGTLPLEANAAPAPAPEPASEPEVTAMTEPVDDDLDLPPAGPGEAIVVIPDFTGMSVGQVIAAAQAAGVKVELEGSGRAVRQFPAPGRALKSITCRITFDPG